MFYQMDYPNEIWILIRGRIKRLTYKCKLKQLYVVHIHLSFPFRVRFQRIVRPKFISNRASVYRICKKIVQVNKYKDYLLYLLRCSFIFQKSDKWIINHHSFMYVPYCYCFISVLEMTGFFVCACGMGRESYGI